MTDAKNILGETHMKEIRIDNTLISIKVNGLSDNIRMSKVYLPISHQTYK